MGVPRRAGVLAMAAVLTLSVVPAASSAESSGAASSDGLTGIAARFVSANAADYDVSAADVGDLFVTSSYRDAHNGVTHVNLNQRYTGLEVFGGHGTVNLLDNGRVVFVGESFVGGLGDGASGAVAIDATVAVEAAAEALDLDEPEDLEVLTAASGPARATVISDGGISDEPIPARLGWQPTETGLRLAWQLTIDASSEESLWNATVDAQTGELLASADWTSHDTMESLSATLGRPSANTMSSATSFPTPANPVNDGSSYRIFRVPNESPNDAPRTLVANPADGDASPFGWHDTDGLAGAEFTITRGNNNHAYLDQDSNNSPDNGADPQGTGPLGLTFDFPADPNEHSQAYRDAVTTNLFYGCNMIHDILYRYGFNEVSGNFQANNYGRGGGQGDYVRCEAADGGGTNNANFSTPAADSGTPRMQMYLWPGNQLGSQNQVTVDGLASYNASWSRFGPPAPNAGIPGTLVYAGTGCNAGLYPAVLPAGNWLAVVDGGTAACTYLLRVQTAQAQGAKGVIIAHNAGGAAPVLTASMTTAPVAIPVVAVTQADGTAIKAAIAGGPTTGSLQKHPNHPGIRDGDFDNGIIFHEYGHGVSLRLTGGPGINCLTGDEQAGEGWSDFQAMTLSIDPTIDNPEGTRGLVPYALFQADRSGGGLRPRPYSRNMDLQPFTYDSIKTGGWLNGTSLALPHGLGHGWTAVLWDMTWDLIDKHGFNPNIYQAWNTGGNNRAIQYVMDGLKFQGCGPGLVVARDAIIAAADLLSQGEDTCMVWSSFARRGLGYSAIQGTTNRNNNTEAFDTHPDCRRDFLTPIHQSYGMLNDVVAGSTKPLRFTADGYKKLDVLFSNSPYSRLVDCTTLATVDASSPFITPRPTPVAARNPGGSKLSVSATGVFNYPWQTDLSWAGTCRELVLTRDDGRQHRAYFRFLPPA